MSVFSEPDVNPNSQNIISHLEPYSHEKLGSAGEQTLFMPKLPIKSPTTAGFIS